MTVTEVIGKTIKQGRRLWRLSNGEWSVQAFGWHPTGPNPRYSWIPVPTDKVPLDVIKVTQ